MAKFTMGRFYIHSHNALAPGLRPIPAGASPRYLIVNAHGYDDGSGRTTTVRGVRQVRFLSDDDRDVEPHDFEQSVQRLADGEGNSFWFTPIDAGHPVIDYCLKKELDSGAKKRNAGTVTHEFVNSAYIESVYPAGATFDIAGVHNTWSSGRTVRLSNLLDTLQSSAPGLYTHLLCGFCRSTDVKRACLCF